MSNPSADDPRTIADREHLKLLAIFYYILAGITAAFSCFALIYVAMGLFMALAPEAFHGPGGKPSPPPLFLGYAIAAFGGFGLLAGWTLAGLNVLAGLSIQRRRRRIFTMVVAALDCVNCVFFPAGAVLGAFTFVVLLRDSVRKLYES